jgi:hypothetical protein
MPATFLRFSGFVCALALLSAVAGAAVTSNLPKTTSVSNSTNMPMPASPNSGSASALDIFVSSPFTDAYDNYIVVGVRPLAGKLRVQVTTGPGYVRAENLLSLVDGSASAFHDTDSAQAAIRWTRGKTAPLSAGLYLGTNAHKPSPTRTKAADWIHDPSSRGPGGKLIERVHWDAPMPPEPRHVDVVLVFTDILTRTYRDHDDRTTKGRQRGDAPAVIGSWSGDLVGGKWIFKINRSDLTPPNQNAAGQREYPTQVQIDQLVGRSQRTVESRTGLLLVKRDFSRSTAPQGNRQWDTGFDIVQQK